MIITITMELDVDETQWAQAHGAGSTGIESSVRKWARTTLAELNPDFRVGLRSVRNLRREPVAPAPVQELVYTSQCQWCVSEIISTTGDDGTWHETDEEGAN